MCNCGKNKKGDPAKMKIPPKEFLETRKAACMKKLQEGTLLDANYCPYCGITLWYYCKNGCKQGMDK